MSSESPQPAIVLTLEEVGAISHSMATVSMILRAASPAPASIVTDADPGSPSDASPDPRNVLTDAIQLHGLIEALEHLQDLGGAKSTPLWAIVTSALPLARKLKDDIERVLA